MGRTKGTKNGNGVITTCKTCGETKITNDRSRKYCSRKCYYIGRRRFDVCIGCNARFKNKGGRVYCSRSCAASNRPRKRGYQLSEEHRKKIGDAHRGEKSSSWKGGVTPWQKKERQKPEYVEWRKAVFERDDYTCVMCRTKGGRLQADHIKSWIKYPNLRTNIDNGRTLCIKCHKNTPTYGRNLKYQQ